MARFIHIAIVSHGQAALVTNLLNDLEALDERDQLQVTIVVNKPESFSAPSLSIPVSILRNECEQGFARNQNKAFANAPLPDARRFFVALNPDVTVADSIFTSLAEQLSKDARLGVVAPAVYDPQNNIQENGRRFPSPLFIIRKVFGLHPKDHMDLNQPCVQVDWVAGMCMLFECKVFASVQGFDERYRLYYEDVDICLRLREAGKRAAVCPDYRITHIGQWRSRRNLRYFSWHLSSLLRFLYRHQRFRMRKARPPATPQNTNGVQKL